MLNSRTISRLASKVMLRNVSPHYGWMVQTSLSINWLVFAVILCYGGVAVAQGQPRSIGGGFYQTKLPTVSSPLEIGMRLDISVVGKLAISGVLEINVRDTEEVTVDISSTFRADDATQASEKMSTSGARLLPTNDGLHLKLRIDPSVWTLFEGEKPSLDMVITVPLATSIDIDAPYLQVSSEGALAGLTINETFEPVEVRGARGIVRVDSRNSPVSVSDLIGGFDIRTRNAKISLKNIEVQKSDPQLGGRSVSRARSEDGRIDILGYVGSLQARTSRADIRGRDVLITGGQSWIENSGGLIDVTFSGVEKNSRVDIRNSYEDIQLRFNRDLSAKFSLRTKDGKAIEFEGLPHRITNVRDNRIEAECGTGDGLVTVRAKYGGKILISGKP